MAKYHDVSQPVEGGDIMDKLEALKIGKITATNPKARLALLRAAATNAIGLVDSQAIQWVLSTLYTRGDDPTILLSALNRYATVYQGSIFGNKWMIHRVESSQSLYDEAMELGGPWPDARATRTLSGNKTMPEMVETLEDVLEGRKPAPVLEFMYKLFKEAEQAQLTVLADEHWKSLLMMECSPLDEERKELLVNIVREFNEVRDAGFPNIDIPSRDGKVVHHISSWELMLAKAADNLKTLSQAEFAWLCLGDDEMVEFRRGNPRYSIALGVAWRLRIDLTWLQDDLEAMSELNTTVPLFPNGFEGPKVDQFAEWDELVDQFIGGPQSDYIAEFMGSDDELPDVTGGDEAPPWTEDDD